MRSVGILLVAGLILGLAGALVPSLGPVWNQRPPTQLLLIADRNAAWVSSTALFAAGLVVALFGVLALCGRLQDSGADTSAWIGIGAFLVGTTLWMVHLGYRLTVMTSVAMDMKAGAAMPDWFIPSWNLGNYLLVAYVALASIGLIAIAVGLLQTGLLPGWSAWTSIGLSVLFIVALIIFRNTLPVLPHVATGLIGIVALIQ